MHLCCWEINHPNYGNLAPSYQLSKRLVVVKIAFCNLLRLLMVSQFSSSEETKDASVRRREPQSAPPGSLPTNPDRRIYETKRTSSTSRMSFKHASAAAAAAAATAAPSTSGTISSNVHLMINSFNISFNRLTSFIHSSC